MVRRCRGAEGLLVFCIRTITSTSCLKNRYCWLVGVPFALNACVAVVVVSASAVRCSVVQCGAVWCSGAEVAFAVVRANLSAFFFGGGS